MTQTLIATCLLLCAGQNVFDIRWNASFTQTYHSEADGANVSFAVRTPPRIAGRKAYPLVVVLKNGLRVAPSERYPFIEVRPSRGSIWGYRSMSTYDVMQVIASAKRHFPVDADRVYLVGFSAGGSGAMHLASCYSDQFAAVMPLVAAGNDYPLHNFTNLPVAFHHGDRDWISSVCNVRVQAERLRALGCPTTLTEYPTARHSIPSSHEVLMNWLFEQSRQRVPKTVRHDCETPSLGRSYWLAIDEFDDPHRRAMIEAEYQDGRVTIQTTNIGRLSLALDLLGSVQSVRIDGGEVPVSENYRRAGSGWQDAETQSGSTIRPYESGGAANLYQGEPLLVVYGTGGERARFLRETANRLASHGGPVIAAMKHRFPVVADTELSDEQEARCNLLLVGKPSENAVTRRIWSKLPLQIEDDELAAADRPRLKLHNRVLGLLHPNPDHPGRLVYLLASFTEDKRFLAEPQRYLMGSNGFDRISQPDLVVLDVDRRVCREMQFDKNWRWLDLKGAETPIPASFRDRSALAVVCLEQMRAQSGADFALWWGPADRGKWGGDPNTLQSYEPATYALADFRIRHRVRETTLGSVSGADLKTIWARWGTTRELLAMPEVDVEALNDDATYRIHIPMDLYLKLGPRQKNLGDPKPGPTFSMDQLVPRIFKADKPDGPPAQTTSVETLRLRERFGEQQFYPKGGYVLRHGQSLPELVWESPALVAKVVDDAAIPTRWFNEQFDEVKVAHGTGRYYVYGEAPVPSGPPLRRAMTCCCIADDVDLPTLAREWVSATSPDLEADSRKAAIDDTLSRWTTTEPGVVELAAWLASNRRALPSREGQWQMENATRHVRLKRKLMGLDDRPLVKATPKPLDGDPAPVLRKGPLGEAGITREQFKKIESKIDEWYGDSQEPMAIVIARNGVIVTAKGYGKVEGKSVTIDTPMLLHSAMKPLIGLQLATYVDRDILRLDEPIGNFLPEFDTRQDRHLTFRAGHVHATGIHFPWSLAFSRLFYFHTWHEALIAHCKREWEPGGRRRYGVVGVILSVRALELLRGRNYWDAMERDLFEPLGIRNVLPGGTGFSAENLARIGVLLDNRGKYGKYEVIAEETHQAILPTSLKPYFPKLNMKYGIGFQDQAQHLGPGSYGHGGGCGTLLVVNPTKHVVFAMVRNDQGKNYQQHRSELMAILREWIE